MVKKHSCLIFFQSLNPHSCTCRARKSIGKDQTIGSNGYVLLQAIMTKSCQFSDFIYYTLQDIMRGRFHI